MIDPDQGQDAECPECKKGMTLADATECDKCERKVCEECWSIHSDCDVHALCSKCDEGENECPVCEGMDRERAETLEVIRRA